MDSRIFLAIIIIRKETIPFETRENLDLEYLQQNGTYYHYPL
jgi:hypothetical protein